VVARLGAEVRVVVDAHRSQARNRVEALDRLAERLDEANRAPAPVRKPTRPTRGATERRLAAKRRTAARKADRRAGPTE
jgi:ribosome-associated protein